MKTTVLSQPLTRSLTYSLTYFVHLLQSSPSLSSAPETTHLSLATALYKKYTIYTYIIFIANKFCFTSLLCVCLWLPIIGGHLSFIHPRPKPPSFLPSESKSWIPLARNYIESGVKSPEVTRPAGTKHTHPRLLEFSLPAWGFPLIKFCFSSYSSPSVHHGQNINPSHLFLASMSASGVFTSQPSTNAV